MQTEGNMSKRPVSSEQTRNQSLLALTKKPEDSGDKIAEHTPRRSYPMNIFKSLNIHKKIALPLSRSVRFSAVKKSIFTTGYFNINQNT